LSDLGDGLLAVDDDHLRRGQRGELVVHRVPPFADAQAEQRGVRASAPAGSRTSDQADGQVAVCAQAQLPGAHAGAVEDHDIGSLHGRIESTVGRQDRSHVRDRAMRGTGVGRPCRQRSSGGR
jgi:hypothetical protein